MLSARTRGRTAPAATVTLLFVTLLLAGCLGDGGSDAPVATDQVRIPGPWVFEPEVILFAVGTNVTWTNDGGQPHTVTFEALGIDETVQPGATLTLRFDTPGRYTYVCRFHPPDMAGAVIVQPVTGNTTQTPDGNDNGTTEGRSLTVH